MKIRCFMDISIKETSKCARCCIYCDEKNTCEYLCEHVKNGLIETEIVKCCTNAYEE